MPGEYCGPERRQISNSCYHAETAAAAAAKQAVRETFAILGVDVDSPKEVEDFRKGLRFGDSLRRLSAKGAAGFALAVAALVFAAFLAGLKIKIFGG